MLWDYRIEALRGTPDVLRGMLQRLGAEGWELVTFTLSGSWDDTRRSIDALAVLKRPYAPQPR